MEDNGTFTCSVKNPPDVQHNLPQTVLTVTQRGSCNTPASPLAPASGWAFPLWLSRSQSPLRAPGPSPSPSGLPVLHGQKQYRLEGLGRSGAAEMEQVPALLWGCEAPRLGLCLSGSSS